MSHYALSTANQQIVVARYIRISGSINRYEADKIGVCSLAPRIKELKEKDLPFDWLDETVTDPNGITHKGIRRYKFDYERMTEEQKAWLNRLSEKAANDSSFEE